MVGRMIVISGCSGGGKSTLLEALARDGHAVVEEPGRRIVREEMERGGEALPWIDLAAFARRALELAEADWEEARNRPGLTFFDRGLVDAAAALEHAAGTPMAGGPADRCRYYRQVFLAPPWPEIFCADAERRHDYDEAVAEYERLAAAYPALGYEIVVLPKASIHARVAFLLGWLGAA